MGALPLAFSAPLVLAALALLPLLWYLLRITPPRPRQIAFPPLRLILDLKPKEETPARTPWWLLLLRLGLAAFLILAMAGPIWNPLPLGEGGKGPLLVVLDDSWSAAPTWDQRVLGVTERVNSAARDGRTTALAPISDGGRDVIIGDGGKTIERLRALKPQPFIPDRMAALPAIQRFLAANSGADVVWISDGLASGNARAFADGLSAALDGRDIRVLTQDRAPLAITSAANGAGALEVTLVRPTTGGRSAGVLRALDMRGLSVGETPFDFGFGRETKARFELPIELRNEIARVEIGEEHSAGAVTLLDERWKRRRVGVVSGITADTAQPLLSPNYYLMKALAPYADVREPRPGRGDPVLAMLEDRVSVMVLADVGVVAGPAHDQLAKFVEDGGLLLRFAGTRLAGSSDDLVPVRLRRGGRVLGGSLSWDTPKKLAPFERESPLFGFKVADEVTVTRQVLAEPEAGLPGKTWAALADGTPLITAARRGKGLIVLVHVTADTTWSNLPLSGLFVDVLRRILSMAVETGAATATDPANPPVVTSETIAPTRTLDGFGALGPPPLTAKPIPMNYAGAATAEHPPGFYGPPDALTSVNTLTAGDRLEPMNFDGLRLVIESLRKAEPVDLRPALVSIAFLLLALDAIVSIWLAGGMARFSRRAAAGLAAGFLLSGLMVAMAPRAEAQNSPLDLQPPRGLTVPARPGARPEPPQQPPSPKELEAVLKTRLAYIVTGDARVDEGSQVGLAALSRALAARTSLNPGEPMGLNPARDELAFYPFIYWPIVAERPLPTADAVTRISAYMKNGGTIVFDTRDANTARAGGPPTPEQSWLRKLLDNVDVPELEVVPRDHVVTKTFYLLDSFVGRTTVGQTWIEALPPDTGDRTNRPARAGDSVSPLVITSNDLAAAWAVTRNGDALFPLASGNARQREMALRGGINLVMYTLTGNYKADQVHVRDLLERLGL